MNKLIVNTSLLALIAALAACSFVSLNPQAQNISVSHNMSELSSCKFLGNTNVSLWSKAGTFQSDSTTESQLDTLARNEAATMGGNIVYPESAVANGQRAYGVYNCPQR